MAAGELGIAGAVLAIEDFDTNLAEAEEAVDWVGTPVTWVGGGGGASGEVVEGDGMGEAGLDRFA